VYARLALFLGGSTYVWYTGATALALRLAEGDDPTAGPQLALMLPSAALLGLGAAVLWTAQGCVCVRACARYIHTYIHTYR
jgi:hypothetical protein